MLIVDAKSDLNLYKQSSYLSQSLCCGSGGSSKETTSDVAELDFNEWVGQSLLSIWLRLHHAVDNVSRLVSDLRYQGLGNFV